jgi:hypothetical protein
MKKLILSFLLAFLVFNSVAWAEDFTLSATIKEYYVATQTDYVILKINNPSSESWFSLGLIGPEKWVHAENTLLKVPSYGSGEMKIVVSPPKDVIPLLYPYQYFLKVTRVGTDSVVEKSLLIRVKQITSAIIKDFKLSCTECVNSVDISGTVYNVGSDSIDLSMIFKVGDEIKTVPLGYVNIYGKKDFQTTISLDGWQPGDYDVEAKLIDVNGKEMYNESGSFKIPVIENVVYDKSVSSTIFGSFITVTAINKGNAVADADLKSVAPAAWYSVYSGPSPTGMAIGGSYYWTVALSPNESTKISYSEVYWPTYAVILIAIAIIVIAYWQSSAFTFTKNVMSGRILKPGKEVSVSLNLKNKNKEIDKAIVRDVVPSGFSVVSKFETVKPMIKKIGSGIELDWKVSKLKPNEERVFHYTIKPNDTIGKKRLPSAVAKTLHGKKISQKNSNKIYLEPEKEETKVMTVKVSK